VIGGGQTCLQLLISAVRPLERSKGTERKMNSKKAWLVWLALLVLLTSCVEEIHGYFTFEKNGSGVLNLEVVYPESSGVKDIEGCSKNLTQIQWDSILYEGLSSINNPSGMDQCRYIYSFNNLYEVEKLHKALGLKLEKLSIDDNYFIYKAFNRTCDNDVGQLAKSVTLSIKPPGNVSSHNAEKVIGNKLTWNLSGGVDCYDISVVSALTQPTEPSKSLQSEKTGDLPLDSTITTWTTIGASLATIIGTAIAYKQYKKKK